MGDSKSDGLLHSVSGFTPLFALMKLVAIFELPYGESIWRGALGASG